MVSRHSSNESASTEYLKILTGGRTGGSEKMHASFTMCQSGVCVDGVAAGTVRRLVFFSC